MKAEQEEQRGQAGGRDWHRFQSPPHPPAPAHGQRPQPSDPLPRALPAAHPRAFARRTAWAAGTPPFPVTFGTILVH